MFKNKITIIIPIYNTPINDLERCFESLFNQTCKSFNIIAIDDGSDDEVKKFLDKLKSNNIYLQILHKKNTGLPDTKNYGLKYVDTEYVCFCDSDDTYYLDFIEKCYAYIKKNDLDLVCGNITFVPNWSSQIPIKNEYFVNDFKNISEVWKSMFEFEPRKFLFNVNVGSVGKLYKTDIVKKILFDKDVTFGEDQLFNRKYLRRAKSILLVPDFFYIYYQNEYAMTRKLLKEIPFVKYKPFWDRMYELDKDEPVSLKQNIRVFNLRLLNGYVNRACASNFNIGVLDSLKKVNEAINHPMIQDVIENIKIFNNTISLLNSINIIILRLKLNIIYLLEKRLIYRLHLNKDKI